MNSEEATTRRFANFATFAAVWTYALIVFGGIVRISGSGLGCGNNWPKCNGHWIPPFNLPTLIEYTHRLLGVSIGLVLISVFVYAWWHRKETGFRGPGGLFWYATAVLVLVIVQGLLGAVTVWFDIPPDVVVVHFATALVIMAILIAAAVRARMARQDEHVVNAEAARADAYYAGISAGLVFATVVLGAFVANHTGAPQACQGFPLCNGRVLPEGGPLVAIHWTHRLIAFSTFAWVLYEGHRCARRGGAKAVRFNAILAVILVTLQIAVAAVMIIWHLPHELQALHLAVGAALWAVLVVWAAVARSYAMRLTPTTLAGNLSATRPSHV